MTIEKIKFRDLSFMCKLGIFGGIFILVEFALYIMLFLIFGYGVI
jgi:hypothetical protein